MGCSESDQDSTQQSSWTTHQTPPKHYLGLYQTEVKIDKDECEPSLKEIISETDSWPPSSIFNFGNIVQIDSRIFFTVFQLRTGEFLYSAVPISVSGSTDPFYKSESDQIGPFGLDHCILKPFQDGRVLSRTKTSIDDKGNIIVKHHVQWLKNWDKINTDCQHVEALDNWTWQPKSSCSESYTITYKAKEPCPASVKQLAGSHKLTPSPSGNLYAKENTENKARECGITLDD